MSIEISVVICTYNRSQLVDQVLGSLAEQQLARERFEIIVVDNNSPDNTGAVVKRHQASQPNIVYVLETRQGHSNARNRGYQEARGTYVAYLDDDCKVPPEWLARLAELIAARRPAICGGPAYAFYDRPKPLWYLDRYGSFNLGGEARPLTRHYVYGMNVIFDRQILHEIGGFSAEYGMVGGAIGYGDEIYPQRRLRALRPEAEIYYDPQIFVYHLVRPEKMTLSWIIRQRFAKGEFSYRLFHGEDAAKATYGQLARRSLLALAGLAKSVVIDLPLRDRKTYPYAQNYLLDCSFVHLDKLGQLFEQFQQVRRRAGGHRRAGTSA